MWVISTCVFAGVGHHHQVRLMISIGSFVKSDLFNREIMIYHDVRPINEVFCLPLFIHVCTCIYVLGIGRGMLLTNVNIQRLFSTIDMVIFVLSGLSRCLTRRGHYLGSAALRWGT